MGWLMHHHAKLYMPHAHIGYKYMDFILSF